MRMQSDRAAAGSGLARADDCLNLSFLKNALIYLRCLGLSCSTRAQQLWWVGLVAPWRGGPLVPQPGTKPESPALQDRF